MEESIVENTNPPENTENVNLRVSEIEYRGKSYTLKEMPQTRTNKATVVIPVYRELSNGNILNLLTGFAKQSMSSEEFDVVFIVNNKDSDAESKTEGYDDNQKTIQIFDYIQTGTEIPKLLSDEETDQLNMVRKSGLRISYVDMSTTGVDDVIIGDLRNIGDEIAVSRSQETDTKEDTIIFNLDADVSIEDGYFEEVTSSFDDETVGVVATHKWELSEESSENDFVKMSISTFINEYSVTKRAANGYGMVVGTPSLISKVSAYKEVGGFPPAKSGEDYVYALKLFRYANSIAKKLKVEPDLKIVTKFRYRPDNPDDFDSKLFSSLEGHVGVRSETEELLETDWEDWFSGKILEIKSNGGDVESEFKHYFQDLLENYILEDYSEEGIDLNMVDFAALRKVETREEAKEWLGENIFNNFTEIRSTTFLPFSAYALQVVLRSELSNEEFEDYKEIVLGLYGEYGEEIDREISTIHKTQLETIEGLNFRDETGSYLFNHLYYKAWNLLVLKALGDRDKLEGVVRVFGTFNGGGLIYDLPDEEFSKRFEQYYN